MKGTLPSVLCLLGLLVSYCSAFFTAPLQLQRLALTTAQSTQSEPSLDDKERSPWASSEWKAILNFGREPGTLMPDEWGATGGRLALDLPIEITSDRPSSPDQDAMLQRNSFRMNPITDSKYVTMEGEKQCSFAPEGQWKIRLPSGKATGKAGKLMGFIDLQSDLRKNDIHLRKGERIYLTAKCWREEELERALIRLRPIQRNYIQKQNKLTKALEHESGDRRLDGIDPVETILGMKDTAQLVLARDEALREYQEANTVYPTVEDDPDSFPSAEELEWQEGPWPGQVEWLTIEPLFMMVRRKKLFSEEYHVVGTWFAAPKLE